MAPKSTPTTENIRHVEAASDDSVAASLPPFEVPFLAMTSHEFKRAVIAALGASRTDFPLSDVLTAADEARKLQWRGNISWPGGPQTDNFNVTLSYKAFGEHVAQAVLPKRCRLQLVMENPLRRIADPYALASEVYVPFRPNGHDLPPPNHCFVLQPPAPFTEGGIEPPTSTRDGTPPTAGGLDAQRSAESSPCCLLRGYSSSATGDEVHEPEFARASTHESSRQQSAHPNLGRSSESPPPLADDNAAKSPPPLSSSPGLIMLDGPPSSWVSNTNIRPRLRRRVSSSPDVEVVKSSKRTKTITPNENGIPPEVGTSESSVLRNSNK
ncbi:uncharacterized protein PGTG_01637 [Puccinia graminis f. sp. tritici CRL 75-36-700-3]|uniref:Uncharacterized protein n=1 Tax=Puccinia graminis f. sp. tritici (strain CRL 75-36-700-3 / race SCCL) TaxID=418459 RepID=E3JSL9_PUCGT|nr:uncharacterized protein PGTG_01637 [Puccinia graminis f. sp. tritici CRL 75-36-700-3]EFP75044.2 hypothetical protein PGTG_01637 [Puccinia graminis f. sp. tritici CRL 75-36-700-3]